jgi:phosphomannomutase
VSVSKGIDTRALGKDDTKMRLRFGTAGARGIFGNSAFLSDFTKLVQAVVTFTRGKKFIFGWDGRKTSSLIAHAVATVPQAIGSDAVLIGLVPTPVVAFNTRDIKADAGFSITASHNPPEFAGLKVFDKVGMEFEREAEEKVESLLAKVGNVKLRNGGSFLKYDGINGYIESLLNFVPAPPRKLRILLDCANGPGCFVTPVILSRLGHEVTSVNCQISWRFPARNPEPISANLSDFCKISRSLKPDVAFAHDGDADRLVVVDSSGRILPHSITGALLLRSLNLKSGAVVLSENMSNIVEETAREMGLNVERAKIGKTFVHLRGSSIVAMEPSKIAFKPWGLWEDGIFAAVLVSNIIATNRSILQEMMTSQKWRYEQLDVPGRVDLEVLKFKIRKLLVDKIAQIREIDGLKFVMKDGSWIMVRQSGTEAKVRIYCEFRGKSEISKVARQIATYIEASST